MPLLLLLPRSAALASFDQFVSTRFTFPSSPLTPAWPTLPFDGVQQALTLRTAGVDAVAALSPSALLIWASGRWIDVNTLGASLAVSSGCRACEGAHDGHDGVFVACGSGVDFLRCDWSSAAPASCSSTQLLALPLRPLTSAVALGGSLFLSPATGGLLRIDFSAPTPRLYLEPACDPHPGLPPYGDLSALAAYAQSIGAQGPGNYTVTCQTSASQPITETLQALVLLGDSIMAGGNVTIHYRTSGGTWRMEWAGGPLDGAVQCAAAHPSLPAVAIGTNQSLGHTSTAAPLLFTRVGSLEGLPYSSVLSLALADPSQAWVGTNGGLAVGDYMSDVTTGSPVPHTFLSGPRWLPVKDESPALSAIHHIATFSGKGWSRGLVGEGGGAWIATAGGLAMIEMVPMTLEQKANQLQSISDARHDRFGLSSYCDMPVWGDVSQCITGDDDNDGLWTCVYAAGLAFKFAVTRQEEDRQRAWHRFEAIEFLHLVTDIPGMVARSILNQSHIPPSAVWYQSKTFPGWVWKGDTSSDEITGHMFALPIIHDLVAQNAEQKKRVRDLVCLQLHYIISNGYTLVDADGRVTTWGRWDPVTLNMNRYFYDGRGINALQILSWISSGERLCPEMTSELQAARDYLVGQHGYDSNVLNAKITDPNDRNDSDDELTFLPFYTWSWATNFTSLPSFVMKSLQRSYDYIAMDRSALYAIIARAGGAKNVRDDDFAWDLRQSSTELILWGASNSQRQDMFSRHPVAGERPQAVFPIPYGERPTDYRWNSDPLDLDGNYGGSEMDAGYFVLPYWMARFHHLVDN